MFHCKTLYYNYQLIDFFFGNWLVQFKETMLKDNFVQDILVFCGDFCATNGGVLTATNNDTYTGD